MSLVLSRRALMAAGAALAATRGGAVPAGAAFSWERLKAHALALATKPYVAPPTIAAAAGVSYDALAGIRYRADRTLPGRVRAFPLSIHARTPVSLSRVENGRAVPIPFARDLFEGADRLPPGADGFSGFRVMNPQGESDWLAFQGSSYFRSAGALDQYGLSARALAIDTGLSSPEEFPVFTRFWLEPGPADALTIYALLESPSATGAWRFTNRRGPAGATQDVSFVLQLRRPVARLGLAPLTSMFWYGEGDRAQATDWRPEIHDSDGLAMLTGTGERIWRPLANPARAVTHSFADTNPRGFGLLQRDRAFDHYQDDGVFYEKRPNAWVEPVGAWGQGAVTLFAMPTRTETDDNIVAFWTPAAPTRAGARYALSYRLRWTADEPAPGGVARTVACWRGTAGRPGAAPTPGATRLVADFAGPGLAGLSRTSGIDARATLVGGKLLSAEAYPVVGARDRVRMVVEVALENGKPGDLRAYLAKGGAALSETLLYPFA